MLQTVDGTPAPFDLAFNDRLNAAAASAYEVFAKEQPAKIRANPRLLNNRFFAWYVLEQTATFTIYVPTAVSSAALRFLCFSGKEEVLLRAKSSD
eukprot:SAG31_NODE_2930_length_4898_cov_3.710356_6_plen_95_part_00